MGRGGSAEVVVDATDVLKPRTDKRDYRCVGLGNALQALIISDPETDKAAASMVVNVGSFSDPKGLEGLAHFLEHMLFFSSEKYPDEDSYSKYLTEHGGHSNAFTAAEHTNYHFDVSADYLEEALDRFSQFFICPLLSAEATSREINAVDSENSKNLTMDMWRMNQLTKMVSSKDHPFHKFGTGNLETLDIGPKSRGVDTLDELVKFYKANYSANLMRLVVYGRESVDDLTDLVHSKFSRIKNTGRKAEKFTGQPCLPEHLQIIVKAVPVREGHSLEMMFPITPEIQNYMAAPSRYLGHLIGHEADGSLFALLKKLGWANSLSAGEIDSSLEYGFFMIAIELTDIGQDHMEEVVSLTFQYIRVLQQQGVAEWMFEEVRAVCEMKFHFQDKRPPISYVTDLAGNMLLYPPRDWLAGSSLPRQFDAEAISGLIEQLKPERVRIFWYSKRFEGKTSQKEPWYGTDYIIERIEENLVQEWSKATTHEKLHLPSANVFIPTDFSLRDPEPKVDHPFILRKTKMSRLWFKPDTKFRTPKACIQMQFNCPESHYSPEASILTRVFTKLLVDYLNEYAYYAQVAGLNYSIVTTGTGFQVSVSGYHHKLITLVEKICDKIVNFEVEEERFSVIKEKVMKDCMNLRFQQPYQQVMYNCSMLLEHKRWHINEFIEVLPSLEARDLSAFFPRVLSRVFFECFIAGNLTSTEAESLVEQIENTLADGPLVKARPPFRSQHIEQRIVKLGPGADWYYPIAGTNPQDDNSALQTYFQVGQDNTHINVLLELFVLAAKREVFHQLRTVEQLGYVVFLMSKNDYGVRGAHFIIQSTTKDPRGLEERVEVFLEQFEKDLQKMSDEDFKKNVDTLVEIKLEKHKNLWEESRFYWGEIEDGTLTFNRPQVEVAALRKVNKEELLDFVAQNISRKSPNRRKLSIQVYGGQHVAELEIAKGEAPQETTNGTIPEDTVRGDGLAEDGKSAPKAAANRIDNIYTFKRSQQLHESLRGGKHAAYA
ncbi:insulin-degrading enzyme-like 1, peroxisomal isoform X2 [Physcomitrium patens]|uniref:Uncharacterized protein n=1 Tax=Physcomitrium patens TaxID=3218 RepID=A0A2K1JGC2_PHYPA|nr:insulin-degrading enzyme-like 1, peroxisomal isoform X2 [Physcomitrium patens]PNR40591.1 hypothetical protein PHYPA_017994 [Physcomitrium patens]|eukprot:XP_024393849.1 insulin-degrading enzyme-like 1, peroxisomal isoform X2 [Physcomitrella patens]